VPSKFGPSPRSVNAVKRNRGSPGQGLCPVRVGSGRVKDSDRCHALLCHTLPCTTKVRRLFYVGRRKKVFVAESCRIWREFNEMIVGEQVCFRICNNPLHSRSQSINQSINQSLFALGNKNPYKK